MLINAKYHRVVADEIKTDAHAFAAAILSYLVRGLTCRRMKPETNDHGEKTQRVDVIGSADAERADHDGPPMNGPPRVAICRQVILSA